MNFFAEVGGDAGAIQIGVLVLGITALCVCANQVLGLWRHLQPRPPMDEQLKHVEKAIMERLNEQDRLAEVRRTQIHERLNAHADRIGYIEGHLGIHR